MEPPYSSTSLPPPKIEEGFAALDSVTDTQANVLIHTQADSNCAAAPADAPEVLRWKAEIQRIEEILEGHERERAGLSWFLKLGPILLLPSIFVHRFYGPGFVILVAASGFLCGHYFVRGHIQERRAHLALARRNLEVLQNPELDPPLDPAAFSRRTKLSQW
jgi:hypothetical protein